MPWLAEDVAVHELPARLLRGLLRAGELVVLRDVAVQRPEQDHGHHAGEEDHDHERVQDGEPVDLTAGHLQVVVPARRPSDRALGPLHVVRVDDLVVRAQVEDGVEGVARLLAAGREAVRLIRVLVHRLLHAVGLDLEAHDAVALVLVRLRVELEVDLDVVVDVVRAPSRHAHRKAIDVGPASDGASPDVARGRGHVVHEPVDEVVVVDHAPELVLLLLAQRVLAQHLAGLVHQHLDLVRRVLDQVTHEDFPEVLRAVLDCLGPAVRQDIVRVGQLRLHRRQLVHLQVHRRAVPVLDGSDPRQVEGPGRRGGRQRREARVAPRATRQRGRHLRPAPWAPEPWPVPAASVH
mmetsp:Transcript_98976/g.280342  ORF Transcript_98976/g.280342 Transcript_98976/m.280342 type:complete len:350 (+) Transcript_98976:861-1910(+)